MSDLLSDSTNEPQSNHDEKSGHTPAWLIVVAGIPLLLAMLVEFIAVLGRNTGWSFVGSIELMQVMILLSSSGALIAATMSRSHAKVTILSRRISGRSGRILRTVVALGGAIFFFSLAAGSAWILIDMWHSHEQSELLGLPYLPLRFVVVGSTLLVGCLYARRIFVDRVTR